MSKIESLENNIKKVFDKLITKDLDTLVRIERDEMSDKFNVYVNLKFQVSTESIRKEGQDKPFLDATINTIEKISNNIKDLEK